LQAESLLDKSGWKLELHCMMRDRIFCLCVLMFAAVPVEAETNREKTVADIRAVMVAQEAAWNRGDVDAFMNGYAHSRTIVFVSGDMLTRGWQTVRDRYKKKYATAQQMGQLKFSDLEITPLGNDAAVALGRWELERKADHPHGRFTLIFRRTPEGWRIVHDHTSAAAPP
jgi:ketosteroid isomerase-like protein